MKINLRILTLLSLIILFGCSSKKEGLDPLPPKPIKNPGGSIGWDYEIETGNKVITASGWEAHLSFNSTTENLTSATGWTAEVSNE